MSYKCLRKSCLTCLTLVPALLMPIQVLPGLLAEAGKLPRGHHWWTPSKGPTFLASIRERFLGSQLPLGACP